MSGSGLELPYGHGRMMEERDPLDHRTRLRVSKVLRADMSPRGSMDSDEWSGGDYGVSRRPQTTAAGSRRRPTDSNTARAAGPTRAEKQREKVLESKIERLVARNRELEVKVLALQAGVKDENGDSGEQGQRVVSTSDAEVKKWKNKTARLQRELEQAKKERDEQLAELERLKQTEAELTEQKKKEKDANIAKAQEEKQRLQEEARARREQEEKERLEAQAQAAEAVEPGRELVTQEEQLALVTQLLNEEISQATFESQLRGVPNDVKREWILLMAVHLKRLGKLLSLNDVITQSLNKMETAMGQITDEACAILQAERATVFAIDYAKGELYSIIAGGEGTPSFEIRIPDSVGIAGHVFQTGEMLNIPDAYDDHRFNQDVDKKSGLRTKAILCAPIQAHAGYKMGVLQVMNKQDGSVFSHEDEGLLEGLAIKVGIHLLQAQTYEDVQAAQNVSPLLNIVMSAFLEEIKLAKAMDVICEEIRNMVYAERASVWLADEATQELFTRSATGVQEIRLPWNKGIVGICFTQGEVINIADPYNDPRFNPEGDKKTGFRTRCILCLPIFDTSGGTIGVIQAINKGDDDDEVFTGDDEYYMKRISTQAGFNLQYARLYEAALNK
eukprot:TRINITY_DN15092_c0_g1_i2.p1 TRINITY_DN15092_c0_g1~~TRINITY_DN15092_c0_g1_i2.p1  ORF type:complete len:617 (-),score=197.72 TRINITY_DN15092_c0_g1_i2:8-1858(-)